jgi:hypothetical protein
MFFLDTGAVEACLHEAHKNDSGSVSYNRPWSWHIASRDGTMAENTIELCDGILSYVEADLDDWIATVGYFCPWSAELVSVKDYR